MLLDRYISIPWAGFASATRTVKTITVRCGFGWTFIFSWRARRFWSMVLWNWCSNLGTNPLTIIIAHQSNHRHTVINIIIINDYRLACHQRRTHGPLGIGYGWSMLYSCEINWIWFHQKPYLFCDTLCVDNVTCEIVFHRILFVDTTPLKKISDPQCLRWKYENN
jgi:hypothetical protein